ncbi:MAG: cation:proton antiporter [Sarcina ventriculi]|nr:cation:proton antiporter [Sarcina ventriculi]MDD7373016.1 cation:proton antiporter [Sarcina ventriculi]MDY7063285.1 cation:proton antiporter [Sarcina ventriculi]
MLSYKFLFDIAVILLSTKALGLVTKRFKLPQVVGALLAGLVLGPAVLNILHETDFIQQLAELGVIVLMFTAGLETDIKELKKSGVASVVIAILGMIVPLILGFILANFFNTNNSLDSSLFLQHMFIGVILTATSVSITVETLRELGKLNSNAGNAILGAAIIDDILGIIALTIISSCASSDTSTNIWIVIGKILLFFILAIMVGIVIFRLMNKEMKTHNTDLRRFVIFSFVFCLLLSYAAEEFFGVADITGTFIAGLILSGTERKHYILSRFETSSYMLLSPIFFASIGIKVEIPKMSKEIIIFSILLIIIAVISKIIGCGLGAKLCKYTNSEALQIGTGMVSRGEVALIMANKGNALGLMSSIFFGPVVIMVVITTIISPILLKLVFHKENIKIA